jgi:mono/diheme cytochrome c family protein
MNDTNTSARNRISTGTFLVLVSWFAAAAVARPPRKDARRSAPKRTAPAVFTARPTPARLAHGRYLVESVVGCFGCHSPHEYVNGEWIGKPGLKGAGQIFPPTFSDFPPHSEVVAPNITPDRATGIGSWTDAEIEQAIRHGVAKGGRPLFSMMPYSNFRVLTDDDVKSIIVYLRTLPPVHNALPTTRMPFPIHVDLNSNPVPPLTGNASAQVRRGWYLVRVAGCADCHTPLLPNGTRSAAQLFAGGMTFRGPFGVAVSLNITPSASGIGPMTEAMFVRTLRTGRVGGTGRKLSPIMPFEDFKNMKESDLRAINAYLRTVPPVPGN